MNISALLEILLFQAILQYVAAYEIKVINRCKFKIFVKSNKGSSNLKPGKSFKIYGPSRVAAHRGCDDNGNSCDTSDDVTLAEMHYDSNGKSWYDISQVDGYNLPMKMEPYNTGLGGKCETVQCNYDLNNCPEESKVVKNGRIVSCKNRNRDQPTAYSESIKASCPNVYTWSKDDRAGMRDCRPGNDGFKVTFC